VNQEKQFFVNLKKMIFFFPGKEILCFNFKGKDGKTNLLTVEKD